MTYRGHVEKGVIVLDETAALIEGAAVEIAIIAQAREDVPPLAAIAAELAASIPAECWDSVPSDGASNLDHYLYGAPKK